MRHLTGVGFVLVLMTVAIAGCASRAATGAAGSAGTRDPAVAARPSPSVFATIIEGRAGMSPGVGIPNPGTGTGNPQLIQALLSQSPSGPDRAFLLPPAVIAMPVRDRHSLFIPLRQSADPVVGPPQCEGLTAGLWLEVVTRFNVRGVQLAVITQTLGHPAFSEAIITGPSRVLASLADPALPPGCRMITSQTKYSGGVRPLPATRVGLRSWAFEITGTGTVPVWEWAEVVRGPGFVLEVQIPKQAPSPEADPGKSLGELTDAAYRRAVTALSGRA
jgi:hypothetical protein